MFYLIPIGLAILGIASIGEKSLGRATRHDLEDLEGKDNPPHRASEICEQRHRVVVAAEALRLLGTAAALVGALSWKCSSMGGSLESLMGIDAAIFGFATFFVLLIVGNSLPWAVARLWAARVAFHGWPLWRSTLVVMTPAFACTWFFEVLFMRLAGRSEAEAPETESIEEEIRTIVSVGELDGVLDDKAGKMIEGVIELRDIEVSEVMTARTDMDSMRNSLPLKEALAFVIEAGHSRVPVFDKNRDDIVGVLVTKDLLKLWAQGACEDDSREWTTLVRPPVFVPEMKGVAALLREFAEQKRRDHMVIVLDEYGGVSGLVTLEDIIEEIVGDIIDEHDKELSEIVPVSDQCLKVRGRVSLDEVNDVLDVRLPEDQDYDTIGGFVFTKLGYVPQPDDYVLWPKDRVRVTVLDATSRRVEWVQVEILSEEEFTLAENQSDSE
jgi:CBS domain containing-hemolysin-like protein